MKKTLLAVLAGALMLSGCGMTVSDKSLVTVVEAPDGTRTTSTTNVNNSDTAAHFKARQVHSQSEAQKVANMTESIMNQDTCQNCTDEGKAYSQILKSVMVAFGTNFQSQEWEGKAPTTWIDVADHAVDPVVGLAEKAVYVGGAVDFADKMLDRVGGVTNIQMGENGKIDSSFNKEINESNASTLYGDAEVQQDNSKMSKGAAADSEDEQGELYCTGDSQCEEGFVCDEPIFTCVPKDY